MTGRAHFAGRAWIAVELVRDGRDRERLARVRAGTSARLAAHRRRRRAHARARAAPPAGRADRRPSRGHAAPRRATLLPNGERHLRARRLAKLYPAELLAETVKIAGARDFSLDELRYEYPRELVPAGETPASHLRKLAEAGARRRWPAGLPARCTRRSITS